MIRLLLMACMFLALAVPVQAKEALPNAEDPVVEARMMALAEELRCLVCQNQTLADSDADLAEDFRREIRLMITQGLSDTEIIEFLVDRYGDFVRYRPPLKGTTLLLWFGPFLLIAGGAVTLVLTLKRRIREVGDVTLTEAEEKRAQALLKGDGDKA